jgi:NAD(P)-dependent dehydrogenase (short-subunit alcohol dehydrogenase family)
MDKQIALITGANKGIGFEIARQLGQKGILVVLGARTLPKAENATARLKEEGIAALAVKLDVTDPDDVRAVPGFFATRFGRLDILINNAGISLEFGSNGSPAVKPSEVGLDLLRRTFETNFFGVYAVTQSLLPLLRKSPAGRIVNHSSILGSLTIHSDPKADLDDFKTLAYNSSKTALNALTVHLAYELKDSGIKVNSAHPGWVKTDMGGEAAPMSIEEGARTAVWLATLPTDGPTGGYFHNGKPLPW